MSRRVEPPAPALMARLAPEYLTILEQFPDGMLDLTNIQRAREVAHTRMDAAATRHDEPGVATHDEVVPGRGRGESPRLRLYVPAARISPSGALLFMHGGGFVMGRASHFDVHCAEIARGTGCVVASVDYRLAPEFPYPAALEDCFESLEFLVANSDRLGVDPARVAVGGVSAGAALAAAVALMARDRGGPVIAFQSLEAPMLDHRNVTGSRHDLGHPKAWNRTANELAWRAYLGSPGHAAALAYASPALATNLAALPPAYVAVSALELFFDEAVQYSRRLVAAAVPVELHVYPNGFHGSSWAIPDMPLSQRWRGDAIAALKAAVGDRGDSGRSAAAGGAGRG